MLCMKSEESLSFEYPVLEQITKPDYRVYKTPCGQRLPSVTTVLSATKDMTAIDAWVERVGEEEAERIKNRSSNLGNLMHNAIEDYMVGKEPSFPKTMRGNIAKSMFRKIKKEFLDKKVESVVGIEVPIYYPGLYAGTVDFIAVVEGVLVIVDWKNSIKIKKRDWCSDYFTQGASYILAHDELFETNISEFRVVMASQPNDVGKVDYEEFVVKGEELEKHKDEWIERLETFYKNFDTHIKSDTN